MSCNIMSCLACSLVRLLLIKIFVPANFYLFFMTMALPLLGITISWCNCHHSRDQSPSNSCFTMESFEMSGANYFPLS